jgi:signal transduction histidine kinase
MPQRQRTDFQWSLEIISVKIYWNSQTMSEIELLRAELARMKREVEESQAQSRQYLQNVAHQLSAPLGAIKWSIEALRDPDVPINRKSTLLSSIYSQATILIHLIKNFSLMSNLEHDHELGQFREKPEPIDVAALAINLSNDFQPQAHEKEQGVTVDQASFVKIFGNNKILMVKNLVAQALSNLLENAVKYADSGTKILITAAKKNGFAISVTSEGIPIADAEKDKIFQRGYRSHAAQQKVAPGTGIGLYLASRIMELHKGRITVETKGRISTFSLVFPITSIT